MGVASPVLETALSGKYQEERAAILAAVEKQNQSDLQTHTTAATLDISLAGSKNNANKMSVVRELPGAHDYWMGGVQIYNESLDANTGKRDTLARVDDRK